MTNNTATPIGKLYTAREQSRAMADLGDTRHLNREQFLVALRAALVARYGERSTKTGTR